ncbi:MAG: excinuclease ABC subunit UvrC [Erysipelotrichaceae bacterium]|nr:excinuclease ABC subunit UvrC [Erysipelotrichaceae bacterium]MDY5252348.1 excinuclease ABC subunit UvrC [Erysipelotrichaceae bacterium]
MNEALKVKLSNLTKEPGCYLMKDKHNQIIYVGKAKNLHNRVNQYFVGSHDYKTTKLVSNIQDFDFIICKSEKEALVLEINLIKKHRPKYNIMFIDDKSYPYIKLTKERFPTLKVVREAKKDRTSKYFGPYPDASAAHQTIAILNKLYPLRKCQKLPKKVCLYYHIGQCLGPCEFPIAKETYEQMVQQITNFLNGNTSELLNELEQKMLLESENLNFEKAQEYSEMIKAIRHISDKQDIESENRANLDAFAYYADKGYISIQGFFVRQGIILEKEFKLIPLYGDAQEEFISFVVQYYQDHPYSSELVLPKDIDISLLNEVLEVKIFQPQKGYRQKIIDMAINNAKEQLVLKFENQNNQDSLLQASVDEFSMLLKKDIHRIELYDNSHIQGAFNVSACVVFEDGLPLKKDYRLYKLGSYVSDVDSMKEVIYRRYFRLLNEGGSYPDCILVDGGIMQINAAKEVLTSLGIEMLVCGLVKDDKHNSAHLVNDQNDILPIKHDSNLFFMLARMQDEVHRVAISYHRKLRNKAQNASILDEIEGVGSVRKKQLLKYFKSFKQIKNASIAELAEVVPQQVAKNIFNTLHNEL